MEKENLYVLDIFPSRKRKWLVSTNLSQLPPQLQAASPALAAATPESYKAASFMGRDGDERGGGGWWFPCRLSREEFLCKYSQFCPTLCDPMDYSPPGSSRQESWSGLPFLLRGIFLTQGLNPGLLNFRQILSHLNHQGSPSTNH